MIVLCVQGGYNMMIDLERITDLLQIRDLMNSLGRFSLQNCCLMIIFVVFIAVGILLAIPIAFFNQ
jgi:hypothetical protein